jgi:hypothetical protein
VSVVATTVLELVELIDLIEQDPELNVVVFASANPSFYLTLYGTEHDPGRTAARPVAPREGMAGSTCSCVCPARRWSVSRRE